jgi:L-threonylcarbamoyladenylate synthase
MGEAAQKINEGLIGVIPTDTVYGLVAPAFNEIAVARVYEVKGRDEGKPFIILISTISEMDKFGALVDANVEDFLMNNWPGALSVIVPVHNPDFEYLHRGTDSLAFRQPQDEKLQALLRETGPIVAPSANPQGEKPASNIDEAKRYFKDKVDFYVDGGTLESEPSTIVDARSGKIVLVREGKVDVSRFIE